MAKRPGAPVRGSQSGRPIMALFDVLGQRWTLRVLWELRTGRLTFRELRTRCEDVSPTVLNRRLKELRTLQLLDHAAGGYGYTAWGRDLSKQLEAMSAWSERWAAALPADQRPTPEPTR